jgi:hypothetical protein
MPNPNLTIRTFFIAVRGASSSAASSLLDGDTLVNPLSAADAASAAADGGGER